jgi:quinolinate synthase
MPLQQNHKQFTVDSLYDQLKLIQVDNPLCSYSKEKCERLLPIINEIQEWKQKKNAVILAHSYVHSDILYSIADHTGDSYALSLLAKQTKADTIVFPAVRFMAETAKILNPSKTVIDPNPNGGCSLADSIDAETVRNLRRQHPEHTFVWYINTTAAVKAECDLCVTSSNVYRIIEKIPNDKIFFLPDKLMGQNIQKHLQDKNIQKEILLYSGTCYVHENFEPDSIDHYRKLHPNMKVLAHPECKPEVIAKADAVCSTTGIVDYVKQQKENTFLVLTECGIASRLQIECPEAKMVGTCSICKYMKTNSLHSILQALKSPSDSQIVTIPDDIQAKALLCIENMFHFAE